MQGVDALGTTILPSTANRDFRKRFGRLFLIAHGDSSILVTALNPSSTDGGTIFAAIDSITFSGTIRPREALRSLHTVAGTSNHSASIEQLFWCATWIKGL